MARPAAADDDRAGDGRAQRRLLPLHAPGTQPGSDGASLDRVEFEEAGPDRTRLVVTATFPSVEARDAMLQAGMEKGVSEGYEKLDALLARRRQD